MTQRLTRREAGLRLLAQSALLSGLPLPLLAQAQQDPALHAAIATALARGRDLRSTIVAQPIPVDSWAGQVVRDDLAYRIALAEAFESASPPDSDRTYPRRSCPSTTSWSTLVFNGFQL